MKMFKWISYIYSAIVMKNFFKITIPVLIIMLVIVELVLRILSIEDPYKTQKQERFREQNSYIPSQFLPNQNYTFQSKEGLAGLDTSITFLTNNYGFRGNTLKSKKVGDLRIFLMGGSTTECLMIDESKAPHTKIQNQLKDMGAEVFSAAKSGDMSVDHLAMLAHRVVHLQPDIIVLFCGINDLKRSNNFDYTFIDSVAYEHHKEGTIKTDLKFFLSNFQIFRRIHAIFSKSSLKTIQWKSNFKEKAEVVSKLPKMKLPPNINLEAYKTNLNSFIGICLRQHIKLILVTQASTWNSKVDSNISKLHWMTSYGNVRGDQKDLDSLLEKYNDVMRELAIDSDILLYDLAKKIPKTSLYFYDDCHFNNNGAAFYADSLSYFIRKNYLKKQNEQ